MLVLHAQPGPIILKIPLSLQNQAQSNDLQLATPNKVGRVQVGSAGRVGCAVPLAHLPPWGHLNLPDKSTTLSFAGIPKNWLLSEQMRYS